MTKMAVVTLGAVERERERERAYSLINGKIVHDCSYLSMHVFVMNKNYARDG